MSSKLDLHQAIETLSESECKRLLFLIATWHDSITPSLAQLEENQTFHIPSQKLPIFSTVTPVKGEGISASEQLIEDRR